MKRTLFAWLIVALGVAAMTGCSDDEFLRANDISGDDSANSAFETAAPNGFVCGNSGNEPALRAGTDLTVGTQQVVVIAVHFNDTPVDNYFTASRMTTLNSMMFGSTNSVAALFNDASSGLLTLEGDVFGPYTIDFPSDTPCGDKDLMNAAAADLVSLDVPGFDQYDIYTFVYPRPNDCQDSFGIGGHGGGNQTTIWTWESRSVFGHELGHVFGFAHAGTPDGGVYGDYSCLMSTSWMDPPGMDLPLREVSAIWKNYVEWFDPARYVEISGGGTHSINLAPAERAIDGVVDPTPDVAHQLVKVNFINQDLDEDSIYLSYRRNEGDFYPVPGINYLMDATHVHKQATSQGATWRHAALETGELYEDGPVRVTPLAGGDGENYFPVQVEILVTPPQSDFSVWTITVGDPPAGIVAGTTDLTVTNNAVAGSPDVTYSLVPSVHTGFAVIPAASSLTLAPGATATVSVDLVPDSGVLDGRHDFSVRVVDDSGIQGSGVAEARFVVDLDPPSVPADLAWTYDLGEVVLTWSDSSDNASGVSFYEVRRDGTIIGTVSSSQSPTFHDPDVESGVVYTYDVRATDRVDHVSDWSVPLDVLFDCGQGVSSYVQSSTMYMNAAPKMPFIASFGMDMTNLNEAGCGSAEFLYRVTPVGSDPIFGPIPLVEETIVIAGAETVTGVPVGMMFLEVPAEGMYRSEVRVSDASTVYDTHQIKYVLDMTDPGAPTGLLASWSGLRVTLHWNVATDGLSGVHHYEILKNGQVLGQTSSNAYVDNLRVINPGQTITYQVRAVDNADNVGPLGNAAYVTFPNMRM